MKQKLNSIASPQIIYFSKHNLSLGRTMTVISILFMMQIANSSVWGQSNNQQLNNLVEAYLSGSSATTATDVDHDGQLSIADITLLISQINSGTQLSPHNSNGHAYVDLGLPSGTMWATCNIDASSPLDFGGLYAWGEITTKDSYSWANYKWCDGTKPTQSNPSLTKYCDQYGYGQFDGKISLDLEDDVAHVKWGGDWHLPTRDQIQELIDNCQLEYLRTDKDHHLLKVTGPNGNSFIMPATGYHKDATFHADHFNYWSCQLFVPSNPKNNHGTTAATLVHSSDPYPVSIEGDIRYQGYAVRPVLSDYEQIIHLIETPTSYLNHDLIDLGLPSGTLWATCNVGASSPNDYGCYYSWGETYGSCEGKTSFAEDNYSYYNGSEMTAYTTNGGVLASSDDVATVEWGGAWRMPTRTEQKELINENFTTQEWTSMNGVYGIRVTSIVPGYEGKSIFFPAAGFYRGNNYRDDGEQGIYWCSSIRYIDTASVPYMSADCYRLGDEYLSGGATSRYYGLTVRPVVSSNAIAN